MNWIESDWLAANNIHAAVTTRIGGLSQGCFASLNPADHVNDQSDYVASNRKIISQMLNLPAEPVWLKQVHGNRVIKADQITQLQEADASFTDQANIVCVVMTADCLPILLASVDGTKIAAIHAGWRGLLNGVISNAFNALNNTKIIAWLGPAIGPACFEVGDEVRSAFINKSLLYAPAFNQKNENKYMANIYQLATVELEALGVIQVFGADFCTFTDTQRFYSYRRDGETGRMATLIWRD